MRKLLLLSVLVSGCGGAPTSPAPVTPPATTVTISGRLLGTGSDSPLTSATVSAGSASATTDAQGSFRLALTAPGTFPLTISGSGLLERRSALDGRATREVTLDAIRLAAPFDLDFYRQLVRDNHDRPGVLKALRHWTEPPHIYLRTVDEAGRAVDATTLATAAAAIINTTAVWTGGRFGVAELEQGTETRVGTTGWLTVRWMADVDPQLACGFADVAISGGAINLFYRDPACGCNGSRMRPRTIKHELGHAMGLWHTDSPGDLMYGLGASCDQNPSAREQYHVGILYSRPVGNVDPDTDPTGTVTLSAFQAR